MWSHKQVSLLIALYRDNPHLYMPKHPLYKNRNARNQALEKIKNELSKLGLEPSILEIKNKWNNLRNNYLVQHRKYIGSVKSGTGDAEQELDRPTLWYFDQMQFILEHSIPRQGQDSLLQLSVTDQENMEQDSQEMQESEVEFEPEVMTSREIMSPSSGHYQLSEDENDEGCSGMNPAKKIKIQSVHIINESDAQTDSSYTPTETPKARANRKTKAKTTNSEDTEFMKTASTALTHLTNAFTREQPGSLPIMQPAVEITPIQTFVDYVGSQLNYLTSDENVLLETQEQILNIIWSARRKLCQK